MITINCSQKFTDIKGQPTEMTVGDFLAEVLWNSRENQGRSYQLATKFANEASVDLKAEDVVFVKGVMSKLGARAGEAGQVEELLEGEKATASK